jgi:hypothetical protein
MNDTEWAVTMSDPDTAPDYFLDALRNARQLGRNGYSEEVIGTASNMLIDSGALNPLVNALILGSQAFDCAMTMELKNGPITITITSSGDAQTE